jgi:serine/threonine-protein kinase RsbW
MPESTTLRIDADLARLRDVRRFVRDTAAGLGADEAATRDLVQAIDEWVTNVIVHGYRGGDGPIEVDVRRVGDELVGQVRDAAPAFDPSTAPPFDPGLPLAARPAGKMGIHLIRELCDRFEHRVPLDGGNEVEMATAAHRATDPAGGTS